MNIPCSSNIRKKEYALSQTLHNKKYKEYKIKAMQVHIYSSLWSKLKNSDIITYRRFLQLAWVLNEPPSSLLKEIPSEKERKNFFRLCDTSENISKTIKITKKIIQYYFKEKNLKKTTFLYNFHDTNINISRKTITRFLNKNSHTEFYLRTLLIILEGINLTFTDFFKKIIEEEYNEYNN